MTHSSSSLNKMKWVILFLSTTLPTVWLTGFECPGHANCSCSNSIRGDYELLCPQGILQPNVIASVEPGKEVKIQCTKPEKWEQLRLLAGIKVGAISYIVIQDCPLPGSSYRELLKTMGIPSTGSLHVLRANMGDTLTRKHLEGLSETTKFNFDGNSLTVLPEDLFHDSRNVTWLDLKNNYVKLPKALFRYIPQLNVLELGNNNLTYLEPGIFRGLTKLRLLNLWGNKLKNLSRALFTDVPNIEHLDLKSNGLINLPPDIFADLKLLKEINLSSNNFTSLPQGLFSSNINLERVQIHSNRKDLITLPAGLFANLTKIQHVLLNDCNFQNLSEDLLAGATSLITVSLQRNMLETLPQDFFKDIKKLDKLNLSYNRLNYLPDQLFHTTSELKSLNLANNELTTLSDHVFFTLTNLEDLNLSNNKLEHISNEVFERTVNLKTVNFSNNKITKFNIDVPIQGTPMDSLLKSAVRLEALYLAHNNISVLYEDWIKSMTQLQILDLSYNSLPDLDYDDLLSVVGRTPTLDLSYNNITFINLYRAEQLTEAAQSGTNSNGNGIRVVLRGNPLICDCHAYDLVNYFKNQPQRGQLVDLDGTDFYCAAGDSDLIGTLVSSVDPAVLTCQMQPCTDNCTCNYRTHDKALVVNCFEKGFEQLPASLPTNKTIKHLDEITNHTELNISHNRLEVVTAKDRPGYERVTNIDLSYNNIGQFNITAFSKNIEVIDLDHNNMSRMGSVSVNEWKTYTSLKEVTLTNNPWICDCDSINFVGFVIENTKMLNNFDNITCKNGKPVKLVKETEVCPLGAEYPLTISLIIAAVGISLGVIIAVIRHYQREIKVWLYAHRMCLWLVTEEELDKDKIYDAFVSYSSLDESFIVDKLIPGLEEDGPTKYKLCLHYRDWIVGDFIPNQIARSVEESRRTIVVLSPNFLESVWGRVEFRTAHCQALSERRARVILILYGDIGPTENLDPELKAYISMNTYVKWGDPWFWDKLRYALPHPRELSKKGVPLIPMPQGRRQKLPSHSEKLINGSIEHNTTESSITTPPADSIIIDPLKLIDSKQSKGI